MVNVKLYNFLKETYNNHFLLKDLSKEIRKIKRFNVKKFNGTLLPIFLGLLKDTLNRPIVFISYDFEHSAYIYTDLINIFDNLRVFYFTSSFKRKINTSNFNENFNILRNSVVERLNEFDIIVAYPESVIEPLPSNYYDLSFTLRIGQEIDMEELEQKVLEFGFKPVDYVYNPGEYSIRGMIFDVYSYSNENPYRIEFTDNIIQSIRTFDTFTQLSTKKLEYIRILPNFLNYEKSNLEKYLFDLIPDNTVIITNDWIFFPQVIKEFLTYKGEFKIKFLDFESLTNKLLNFIWINNGQTILDNIERNYEVKVEPQPCLNKDFNLLCKEITQKSDDGYKIFFSFQSEKQLLRFKDIFKSYGIIDNVQLSLEEISYGFIDKENKICVYTEHEFFNRYIRHKLYNKIVREKGINLENFYELKPGDYVVHSDHGIAVFAGLEKVSLQGKVQEKIKLIFRDNVILYESISELGKIVKYRGREGETPKLSKLGSGAWQKIKERAKNKVKDIARNLIKIYAQRLSQKGFAFSPDTYLQEELESSFYYEDTPDQYKAMQEIKKDMESPYPMDRLVCGDVGFGKTELAVRAAFKAVYDNKQVVLLAPTTVLCLQHYLTFKERLKDFPVTIDYLTRTRTKSEEKKIKENLKNGKIDIIIGTHKLLSNDVKFKDLGLLIIDEEQKFGVIHKEKLREIKANVDTLTLTATPIPRTLQFSLLGIRDMSLLLTPPPNRQPITTEVHTFNEEIIKRAIEYELMRGGQVFFVHNRIDTIQGMYNLLQKLVPYAKIAIAHGRMKPTEIEEVILDFMMGKFDVLLCTSIIENGMDIPNANTMIINNGHLFGLSDLHQLRGRVGRTNKKAFCYILVPSFETLTDDCKRRLKAIEEYSDLGSGFYIAMSDLEIRGAGNLLGAEQSGFITEMGYDTFIKIIQEAVEELKIEQGIIKKTKEKKIETTFESDLELYIPENYINNYTERLKTYKEISLLRNKKEVYEYKKELQDRYGKIPDQMEGLFKVLEIRWLGEKLCLEKIIYKNKNLICFFVQSKDSKFFRSKRFDNLLSFISANQKDIQLKENNNKIYMTIKNVPTLNDVIQKLNLILGYQVNNYVEK